MAPAKKSKLTANTPISGVKGVGEKTAALFVRKGVETAGDLITYYPRAYDFYEPITTISAAEPGRVQALRLVIVGSGTTVHARGKTVTYFRVSDGTGTLRLTFFNMPYLTRTVRAGTVHIARGRIQQSGNGNLYMEQPRFFTEEEYAELSGTYQPQYPLTTGLKNGQVQRAVRNLLAAAEDAQEEFPDLTEYLEEGTRLALGLMPEQDAVYAMHFPKDPEQQAGARDRLAFDEFFFFLLAVEQQKQGLTQRENLRPMLPVAETERLIEALPFALTGDQLKTWQEIKEDLSGPRIMNRLIQGDVGSGKTILAFLSLLMAVGNGRQGALMAPTEVLARQHMQGLTELVKAHDLPIRPVLLTGAVTGKSRKEALEALASGEANVAVGTHALLEDWVTFRDLGLVITDEQHRFGVRQRKTLAVKGEDVPVLVMSATPIPRTLALILYGDLSVSRITEMPKGRLPIKNTVLDESYRDRILRFMVKEIDAGHQVYVICPAIEADEESELDNVEERTAFLREKLPSRIRVGSFTGRMKSAEKEKIMDAFGRRDLDVLVSTTVIEVGINVPNATVMVIENAERFGLAQLHQLRGRIGRGSAQSYCIFMVGEGSEKPKRLEILEKSNDGFAIAEEDLKLRGPGELNGLRQSGELGFALADIYEDAGRLYDASDLVRRILSSDPSLGDPENHNILTRLSRETTKSVDFRSI